jgi:type I restriction enzyme S subunit
MTDKVQQTSLKPLNPVTLEPLKEGWRWVKLGEVCKANPPRPKNFVRSPDAPTTFVPMAAVDEKTGTIFTPGVFPYSKVFKGYTYFEENDVLFAKITPCMQNGKHVIARNLIDGIGFGTTEFHVLRPNNEILSEWIYYFIRQPYFLHEATAYFTGAVGQQRVPDSFLSNYIIPLPAIEEQKRVATKIQELMQEVELARTACEKELEAANTLPAAYLREVFESEEAKKWERKRLGEVVLFIKNGIVAEQNFNEKGFAVTRIETISNGTVDSEKIGWVNLPLWDFADFKLFKGDILFSHINSVERLGNCAIYEGIPENLYHGMNLLRIKADESILDPYFLLYWLRSDPCKDYYVTNARRAIGQASLNQEDIKQIPIRLPTLPVQQSICAELKEKMAEARNLQSAIQNQQSALNALPQAILRKAFRGEL